MSFITKVYDTPVSKVGLSFEIALLHHRVQEVIMNPYNVNDSKEKLARYHAEADVARLTRGQWRKRWAEVLHNLADRLEPPAKVGRQMQVR
jgi:hypothetical protein